MMERSRRTEGIKVCWKRLELGSVHQASLTFKWRARGRSVIRRQAHIDENDKELEGIRVTE